MAFEIANFKEAGGPQHFVVGGQLYIQHSTADTLGTMMVSGYLDGLSGTLNSGDLIILSGTDGAQMVRVVNTAGVITLLDATNTGIAATHTGAGAVAITARSVDLSSGGVEAWTLVDGTVGQIITLTMTVDMGDGTLTPATALGWTNCVFTAVGQSITLEFKALGWVVVGRGPQGITPLVA